MKTRQYSWQDGKSLRLEVGHTLIMGILNGTPDSFPMVDSTIKLIRLFNTH